jgi:hypothetical protein
MLSKNERESQRWKNTKLYRDYLEKSPNGKLLRNQVLNRLGQEIM